MKTFRVGIYIHDLVLTELHQRTIHASPSWAFFGVPIDCSLLARNLPARSNGIRVQGVLEGKQTGGSDDALGDLGSDACNH
jgi:hypothetical protein